MIFVIICKDKADPSLRARARAGHLEFVADRQNHFIYGGPLIEDGAMVGSLFVLDFADRAALDAHLAGDPYFTEGVFETVEVYESRHLVPETQPGAIRAEAEKARAATAG